MKKMRDVLYRIWIDPQRYRLERPVRMTLLADLHNNQIGRNNEILIQRITRFHPDLILVAGDLVVGEIGSDTAVARKAIEKLCVRYPVYYANGNHEHRMKEKPRVYGDLYKRYRQSLTKKGVHFLENKKETVNIHGMPMTIYGLELGQEYFDRSAGRKKLRLQEMENKVGTKKEGTFSILLAHNPVFFETYAAWGADLVCSGHLHGGMARIPGIGGVISPQLHLFPKYDRGKYEQKGSAMIVSAGLGAHTIPFRPFNPIELVEIELTNERDRPCFEKRTVRWKRER